MNDPNGTVIFNQQFHLYYQYNPTDPTCCDHQTWGHAITKDLITFDEQEVAIN